LPKRLLRSSGSDQHSAVSFMNEKLSVTQRHNAFSSIYDS
jgi:hypothetical protein